MVRMFWASRSYRALDNGFSEGNTGMSYVTFEACTYYVPMVFRHACDNGGMYFPNRYYESVFVTIIIVTTAAASDTIYSISDATRIDSFH